MEKFLTYLITFNLLLWVGMYLRNADPLLQIFVLAILMLELDFFMEISSAKESRPLKKI